MHVSFYVAFLRSEALYIPGLCPLRWKGITMRKTFLALAAAVSLAVSAVSPAYAFPRYYSGPGGYPYYSGYVDARLAIRPAPATGRPSASGTVMLGACAACASAADQIAPVSVPRPAGSAISGVH
jgi:hypothetical protein